MRLSTIIGILLLTVLVVCGIGVRLVSTGYFKEEPVVEIKPVGGANGTLTVATDADYWPYSFVDREGRLSGREIELVHVIANMLDMKVEVRPMKRSECLKAASENKVDLVLACAECPAGRYLDGLLCSVPDGDDSFTVFGKEPLASLKELGDRRLAQFAYSGVNPRLVAAGFGSTMKLYSSHREALLAIERGEADYIVIRYNPAIGLLRELGITDIRSQCTAGHSYLCIGVNSRKPELLRKVNDAIMVLRVNGEIGRLTEKWLTTYVKPDGVLAVVARYPKLFGLFLLIISAFIVVLLWIAHVHSGAAARLRANLDVVEELVTRYTAICYVDLETGTYEAFVISGPIAKSVGRRTQYPLFYDLLHGFIDSDDVHLDSRSALRTFYPSDEAWRETLKDRKRIGIVFRRKYEDGIYRWTRMDVIRCGKTGNRPRKVVVAFSECDAEFRKQNEHRVREQILETLTKTYFGYNITVNLSTLRMSLVRGVGCERVCMFIENHSTYGQAVSKFAAHIPDEAHRRQALEMMSVESLRRFAANGKRGFVGSCEYPVVLDDSPVEWRETNVFINVDADGIPVANIVGRDITERKRQMEAEKQLGIAQEARKAQSEFLFNMSHDVRSPMHAIMGFVDMITQNLSDETRPCDERLRSIREDVDKIRRSGDLLFSLLNSVLDVSRLEMGRLTLVESAADVLCSFDGVKATTLALAKEKNIDLTFEFGEIADRHVFVDVEKANRIFLNILTNAVKYTKEGGRIRACCEQVGHGIYRFTFSDNGIGMAPEFLNKVYDRFAREENTTMSGVAGIGLGLSIVKTFVDLMGGTITCTSEKGVGTTFVITLPCRLQEGPQKSVDQKVEKSFAGCHVLLVDDAKLNRDVSKFYLKAVGCEVDVAEDGAQAVERVCTNGPGHYCAVLMDIQMPVMDGYEATRRIRCWEQEQGVRSVPIIALSANAFEEDRQKAIAAGMSDHVAKGVKAAQLREILARWI